MVPGKIATSGKREGGKRERIGQESEQKLKRIGISQRFSRRVSATQRQSRDLQNAWINLCPGESFCDQNGVTRSQELLHPVNLALLCRFRLNAPTLRLRQTGKADNMQRTYRGQLVRFAAWCDKSWLDVTPSDIGKYRRDLKLKGLKPTSINHALNTLRSFYQWLRRSNGYPMNQPLPTDAIDLERQPQLQADHIEAEDLSQLWAALELEEKTRVRDRAIIAVLSHGLRAAETSALNVEHWNGKILKIHRSKGQNVSEVPLSRAVRSHLEAYLEWRWQRGGMFEPLPESPLFLAQDPKSAGHQLGYKGLHRMVKKLGTIAGVEDVKPHRFRHTFGTEVTRRGVDPLFGKELMGIKSDKVFQRYTKGVFKQAAAEAYLKAIGEDENL